MTDRGGGASFLPCMSAGMMGSDDDHLCCHKQLTQESGSLNKVNTNRLRKLVVEKGGGRENTDATLDG